MRNPGYYVDYFQTDHGYWAVELFDKNGRALYREDGLPTKAAARARAIEILAERLPDGLELKEVKVVKAWRS